LSWFVGLWLSSGMFLVVVQSGDIRAALTNEDSVPAMDVVRSRRDLQESGLSKVEALAHISTDMPRLGAIPARAKAHCAISG
jgi:hypothetical protein